MPYQNYSAKEKRGLFKKMKCNSDLVEYLSEREMMVMEMVI